MKSGRVVIKVRRKRKRHAPNPPAPSNNLQAPYSSNSSSNLVEREHVLSNGHVLSRQNQFTQSASCLEADYGNGYTGSHSVTLNSLNNSENSLTLSNDDVFTDSTSECSNYLPKYGSHLNGNHKHDHTPYGRKRVLQEQNVLGVYGAEKHRTHSASAIEDINWNKNGNKSQFDYVNTSELAKQCNYGVPPSSVYMDSSDAELSQYQSDSEVLMCERIYRQRKASKNSELFRQANNATPTSLWSCDGSEFDFSSEPSPGVGKVRTYMYRQHFCTALPVDNE